MGRKEINVPLIKKVLVHIKEEPLRLDMNSWIWHHKIGMDAYIDFPPCGTMACFAGWTYILGASTEQERNRRMALHPIDGLSHNIRDEARELLGLTSGEASFLFTGGACNARRGRQYEVLVDCINEVLAERGLEERVSA